MLSLCCVGGCLCGCSTAIKNQGEVGIRFGNEITFFSRAAKTADEPATSELDVPAVEELILKDRTNDGN